VLDYIPFAPHNVSSPIGTVAAAYLCAAVSFALEHRHSKGGVPFFGRK
jgi:L-alanine-DL-glutamate epimerase-like enolase superfamily enzyme